MKKYICTVCEYIYDPAQGDPDSGIEPGTAFEDIPDDWTCPLCGVGKEDFEPYEGKKLKERRDYYEMTGCIASRSFLISAHAELCFVSLYIIYYSDGLLVVSKY